MNNSRIAYENIYEDDKPSLDSLQERQSELTTVVEALKRVSKSQDWKTLKRLVFDGVVKNLESQMSNEASKKEVSAAELYRLQGQLVWARKYVDLEKLSEFFRSQVEGIKSRIHEQKDSGYGEPTRS